MQVRQTLLPNDLQYCLDGAAECCGITAAADIALRLYGDAVRIDHIMNSGRETGGRRSWRVDLQHREIALERYAAEIIAQLPGPRRTALVERGLLSLCHDVVDKADWLAACHYEDKTKGGNLRPFLRRWRLTRDMRPTPKMARHLRSREAIKRYIIAEGDELPKQRKLFSILSSLPAGGAASECDRDAIFRDLDGQLNSHRITQRAEIERQRYIAEMNARGQPIGQVDGVLVRLKPGIKQRLRNEKHRARKAVKRAAVLAAAVLGASTVSAFARGEPVMLNGPDVIISARLVERIHSTGHGALRIGIHDVGGEKLAGLCVYQEAPALDQLVSLALHVQSGCIGEVLNTGNLYAIEPKADDHPVIAAYRKRSDAPVALQLIGDAIDPWRMPGRMPVSRDTRAMFDAGKAAYIAETLPIYEDIIATFVFGPAAKIFRLHRNTFVGRE